MSPRYTIIDREFKNQKEFLAFINARKKKFDPSDPLWPALLERHPEKEKKIGVGVKGFSKGKSEYGTECIFVERIDGTRDAIGINSMITGKSRDWKLNLFQAMRESVSDQIASFRRRSKEIHCGICGDRLAEAEVDHVKPFKTLVDEFLKDREYVPQSFDDCPRDFAAIFKPSDLEFQTTWQQFHFDNATLRLVHPKCNRSRIRKVGDAEML